MEERARTSGAARNHRPFSEGRLGKAHIGAHRALNTGKLEAGYRSLLPLISDEEPPCSEWLHLQWHLLVFELNLGRQEEASLRFSKNIKEAILGPSWAPTDGPSSLWRLHLARANVELPWAELALRLGPLEGEKVSAYQKLHLLLALGGARRTKTLKSWLAAASLESSEALLLHRAGLSMLAYAEGNFSRAGLLMHELCPNIQELGGSGAQNALFPSIARHMFQLAAKHPGLATRPTYELALTG